MRKMRAKRDVMYMCIHTYIFICVYTFIYVYMYVHETQPHCGSSEGLVQDDFGNTFPKDQDSGTQCHMLRMLFNCGVLALRVVA